MKEIALKSGFLLIHMDFRMMWASIQLPKVAFYEIAERTPDEKTLCF